MGRLVVTPAEPISVRSPEAMWADREMVQKIREAIDDPQETQLTLDLVAAIPDGTERSEVLVKHKLESCGSNLALLWLS